MVYRMLLILAALVLPVCAAAQQSTNADWVGVWHASIDGLSTDTLTLAADTGQLGGTIVLDMVSREDGTPHVIASEPHVLLNPQVKDGALTFYVKNKRPSGASFVATFTVTLQPHGKANVHCTNCGPNAPTVELVRE